MATSRIKTSSILQGFPKSRSLLAGNAAFSPDNFESLSTVIVGSGGSSSITFSSIPQGYAHLQIRGISKTDRTNRFGDTFNVRLNSDTGSNYAWHELYGNGGGTTASAGASATFMRLGRTSAVDAAINNIFGVQIIDILDYTDTNKYTTVRSLDGDDLNGEGYVGIWSGLWQSTSAVTSVTLIPNLGTNWVQYTKFALYGIKD
jgi:hypothetical protein